MPPRPRPEGLVQAAAEVAHVVGREQQVDAQPGAGPGQLAGRPAEPVEDARPAGGVEPVRPVGREVDHAGVRRPGPR